MTGNIIRLGDKTGNAEMQDPVELLKDAIKEYEEGGYFEGREKLLILSLDDKEGEYSVSFMQAGMKMSQCVSLCEVSKAIFLKKMNYI